METSESHIKISVTGRTGARQKLERSIKSANRIYALVDANAEKYERAAQSLFKDLPKVHILAASNPREDIGSAPVLIALPEEKSFFAAFLPEMGKTFLCMLIASPEEAHDLKNFLRHRLEIKKKDDKPFTFKFYDTKLARPFINSLSTQRAVEFFGPVKALIWPESDMRYKLRWHYCSFPSGKRNVSQPCMHDISGQPCWEAGVQEWKKFESNYAEDVSLTDLCRNLLYREVNLLQGLSDTEVRQKVRETVATAQTCGLFSEHDIYKFCKLELDFYPGLHLNPKFKAILKDSAADDPYKMQGLLSLGMTDWHEMKVFSEKYLENPDIKSDLGSDANSQPVDTTLLFGRDISRIVSNWRKLLPSSAGSINQDDCNSAENQGEQTIQHNEEYPANNEDYTMFPYEVEIAKDSDGFVLPASPWLRKYWDITEPVGQVGFTCALYFRGGHLPEMQAAACECLREYVQILGDEARCSISPYLRLIMAGKKGLRLMDEAQVATLQKNRKWYAYYLVCSNATREEFDCHAPRSMFEVKIPLKSDFPIFWDKKAPPEVHAHPGIDKQTSAIFASFAPSMFPGDEPHMAFAKLVHKWCQRLRPVHGTAGWGITRSGGRGHAERMRPFVAPYLLRFPGLDMPNITYSYLFAKYIANINWLTIINGEMAEQVGGPERLKALGEDFHISEYPSGYVIQAGERPKIGDRNERDIPGHYGKVQNLLLPLYPPLPCMGYITPDLLTPGAGSEFKTTWFLGNLVSNEVQAFLEQWLHRFDANWRPENT